MTISIACEELGAILFQIAFIIGLLGAMALLGRKWRREELQFEQERRTATSAEKKSWPPMKRPPNPPPLPYDGLSEI